VEQWLLQQGLSSYRRNFNSRLGEIDLIMHDADYLVFIEVRFRKSSYFGSAVETVTVQKQQRLIRAAEYFLVQHPDFAELPCRFDVIGIELDKNTNQPEYTWLKNAFDLS